MSRFWVYIDSKIQGPVDIPSLRKVPGFNLLTQVCTEGEQTWRMADDVIEIKSYFISPPRLNSFALDTGNAAPKMELAPNLVLEEFILPETKAIEEKPAPMPAGQSGIPGKKGDSISPVGPAGLRAVCAVCDYKNPRDVPVCMKCGEPLKGGAPAMAETGPALKPLPLGAVPSPIPMPMPVPVPAPAPASVATAAEPQAGSNTTVEIPISKLLIGVVIAAVVSGGSFFGYRTWKKKHSHKAVPPAAQAPSTATHQMGAAKSSSKHYTHRQIHHVPGYVASALPGIRQEESAPAEPKQNDEKSDAASYRVVAEATPIQKRYSSPLNSPYAVKRRANEELWTTQEGHAIQQVQRNRIYGGLRTTERNAEILMQILRDREYNTAFESGKRIYLYNDSDWSAVQKEGPVYEVRLTFSGGKDPDGAPKKPLHFAFATDLERGTVEPGGQDQVRSNTLHAFFDESRIAPEDRRAIAKDTEELVLAAQPGASPLAFDTVVRQFAKVYSTDALTRVANAYGLHDIKNKLAHDPRLGSEESTGAVPSAQASKSVLPGLSDRASKPDKPTEASKPSKSPQFFSPSKGGPVEFGMESGSGKEKTFLLRATSHASVARLWETLTGYDRLKQFIPDMLASEREGQDGAATIVHTVCLTRFMVFVFKVNLHLRVIEHPQQHSLEFERIAGDFESFRGSIEITTDPATRDSQIGFHATLVPSGHTFGFGLEGMARKLLVTQIDAIRAKAESN